MKLYHNKLLKGSGQELDNHINTDIKIQIILVLPLTFLIADVEAVFKISREFILGNLGQ